MLRYAGLYAALGNVVIFWLDYDQRCDHSDRMLFLQSGRRTLRLRLALGTWTFEKKCWSTALSSMPAWIHRRYSKCLGHTWQLLALTHTSWDEASHRINLSHVTWHPVALAPFRWTLRKKTLQHLSVAQCPPDECEDYSRLCPPAAPKADVASIPPPPTQAVPPWLQLPQHFWFDLIPSNHIPHTHMPHVPYMTLS